MALGSWYNYYVNTKVRGSSAQPSADINPTRTFLIQYCNNLWENSSRESNCVVPKRGRRRQFGGKGISSSAVFSDLAAKHADGHDSCHRHPAPRLLSFTRPVTHLRLGLRGHFELSSLLAHCQLQQQHLRETTAAAPQASISAGPVSSNPPGLDAQQPRPSLAPLRSSPAPRGWRHGGRTD